MFLKPFQIIDFSFDKTTQIFDSKKNSDNLISTHLLYLKIIKNQSNSYC